MDVWHGGVSTVSWTCDRCGTWVAAGEAHVCSQLDTDWQPTYYPPYPYQQWDRLIKLLERVAASLERLEGAIGG
jgi:hypothetical protein